MVDFSVGKLVGTLHPGEDRISGTLDMVYLDEVGVQDITVNVTLTDNTRMVKKLIGHAIVSFRDRGVVWKMLTR